MIWKSPYPSVPVSTNTLDDKILDAFRSHVAENPKKIALIAAENPNKHITYKELYDQSLSTATFLAQRDFRRGDVMCVVLPNCFEYVIGLIAANKCGGAISGASALFTDYELERQFLDSRSSVVLTDEAHLKKVQHAAGNCPLIKTIICIKQTKSFIVPSGVCDYDVVSKTPVYLVQANKNIDDLAILPYSSGTTGSPKGVMLSHKNIATMIDVVKCHYDLTAKKIIDADFDWKNEHLLLMLPFYHIYGFGVLTMALLNGTTGIVFNKFDPIVFLEAIQRYKVKFLFLVPPIVLFMAKHPLTEKYDLSSVTLVFTGAAPCGKELCEEFYKKYKNVKRMAQGYGMTECGMASHLPRMENRDDYITVGPVCANCEQKIVDPSTGKELGVGQRGEICVKSVTVMMGYLNRPQATAESIDKDGWLHTGDIGYVDEKGDTFIVDRLKELIKVKGLQVPPAELEDLLLSHPSIKDAAVIGLPDEKAGEKPKAFVVRSDPKLTATDVQKFVESKVSSYKFLTGGVEFIEEIPKSPAGKILRRVLKDMKSKL